jgi:uncharacterized membrane protein YphA (DoxX/SURF4 family)
VNPRLLRAVLIAGRLFLGGILVYAAYTKLKLPWISFAATIEAYQLLPDWGVIFVARTLPPFELVLGLMLIAGVGLRWVAAAASALLLAFFLIMVRAYALGMDIDCGCFGPGDRLSAKTLVRDGLLLALALGITFAAFRRARRPPGEKALESPPATA